METITIRAGEIIKFGSWKQNESGKTEPVEWLALAVENGRALVISRFGLETKQFNGKKVKVSWDACSLRKWLNNDFFDQAFSAEDKDRIAEVSLNDPDVPDFGKGDGNPVKDRIFLLSIDEVKRYMPEAASRICQPTPYARNNGAYADPDNGNSVWWLRTPGQIGNGSGAIIGYDGKVYPDGTAAFFDNSVVRPAFWMILSEDGRNKEEPAESPRIPAERSESSGLAGIKTPIIISPSFQEMDNFFFEGKDFGADSKDDQLPDNESEPSRTPEDMDNREPVYVIMSLISCLTRKYGTANRDLVLNEMQTAADAIAKRKGWSSLVYCPDQVLAIDASEPSAEQVHQALVMLDNELKENGLMIGALLIVGGPDVVPFFVLANPAASSENNKYLFSDAPYAALDIERCFEMQWLVGRLPGDSSKDPGLLLKQLRRIQEHHYSRFLCQKENDLQEKNNRRKVSEIGKCFGYTSETWVIPSSIVYGLIEDSKSITICPPTTSEKISPSALTRCDFAYFNLHGGKSNPNWYGERKKVSFGPRCPVALEIRNLAGIQNTPKVIYTEACYGAEIPNRNEKNCISLHFLGKSTHVFIGSTTTALGGFDARLMGADLLGYFFWKNLLMGISCGEAFRRAKNNMAESVELLSGGLDAETLVTLIEFVFYGDPLYSIDEDAEIDDILPRSKNLRDYELLSEETDFEENLDPDLAKEIFSKVISAYDGKPYENNYSKCIVSKQINHNRTGRYNEHALAAHSNYVITYILDPEEGTDLDPMIVRVTIRDDGIIQKMAFSR